MPPRSTKRGAVRAAPGAHRTGSGPGDHSARKLDTTRSTSRPVLDQGEIEQLVLEGRAGCAKMIRKAVDAVSRALQDSKADLALRFLERMGVLKPAEDDANARAGMPVLIVKDSEISDDLSSRDRKP